MLKLRINPIVAKDLKNIRDYIAEDSETYAAKTIKAIYGKFEQISDCGYGGYARSYSFVGRLQTTVLYFGYDQNYERKSYTAAFPFSSGIKTGIVGRTFVESVILCSNSQ